MNKPLPIALWVTTEEGGRWIPWDQWTLPWDGRGNRQEMVGAQYGFKIHSVGFDNGWVFDNYGGWREWDPDEFSQYLARLEKYKEIEGFEARIKALRAELDGSQAT